MRSCVVVLIAGLLQAQSTDLFSKAPPDVDSALRSRVNDFYGLHVQSKFRAAEKYVCEDSRDAYFDAAKRAVKSFEVIRVNYDPGYQSARVVTNLTGDFFTHQGAMTSVMPLTSFWKVVDGSWCYYIPPIPKEVETPFGISKKSDSTGAPQLGAAPMPNVDPQQIQAQLRRQVKVSRTEMKLKGYEKSNDEIEIQNGTGGPIEIGIEAHEVRGLKRTLSATTVAAGRSATLRLDYEPPDPNPKPAYQFTLTVEPFGLRVPIRCIFDIPDKLKDELRKLQRK